MKKEIVVKVVECPCLMIIISLIIYIVNLYFSFFSVLLIKFPYRLFLNKILRYSFVQMVTRLC